MGQLSMCLHGKDETRSGTEPEEELTGDGIVAGEQGHAVHALLPSRVEERGSRR